MKENVANIIKRLQLSPHPEGGYFKETYRSDGLINPDSLDKEYNGDRNYSTCIYFLLTSDKFSSFHRIKQDEIWHFYDGTPLKLHMISQEGKHSEHLIGRNLEKNESPQFVVPGGFWFAAEVIDNDSFSLVGCTVSPGFSFDDFEMISRGDMVKMFPNHKEIITRMTHA